MTKILRFLSRLPNTKHKIALFFFRIYIAFPIAVSPIGKKKENYMKFCFIFLVSIDV